MTTDLNAQAQRRDAIVRILRRTAVARQAELVALLRREGFDATQSSVSRDLRELGVVKGADRYLLPAVEDALTPSHFETVRSFVKGYRAAGPDADRAAHLHRRGAERGHRARQGALARSRRHHRRRRHHLHRHGRAAARSAACTSTCVPTSAR